MQRRSRRRGTHTCRVTWRTEEDDTIAGQEDMSIGRYQTTTVPSIREKIAMDAVQQHFLSSRYEWWLSNTGLKNRCYFQSIAPKVGNTDLRLSWPNTTQ